MMKNVSYFVDLINILKKKKYIITCSINLAVLKKAFLKKIFKSSTYICCFQFSSAICRILRKLNNVLLLFYLFLCVYIKKTKINKEGSPIYKKDLYYDFLFTFHSRNHYDFPISIHNSCFESIALIFKSIQQTYITRASLKMTTKYFCINN